MKAILEFGLPEETTEFHAAILGSNAIALISELDNHLRIKVKHADEGTPAVVIAAYEAVRQELARLLNEYDVSIY